MKKRIRLKAYTLKRWKCPHCGNTNRATLEGNGLMDGHPDLTVLCTAMVPADETSFDVADYNPREHPSYDAATDRAPCGMQWDPYGD